MSRQASGVIAWLTQRVTAVYLAVFMAYLFIHFLVDAPADDQALRAWVAQPMVTAALLIFFPILLSHAWVGIRDVFLDYVKNVGLRMILLALVAFMFLASGLWGFKAIVIAVIKAGMPG
ncbi:succinate dehydrogenase, hydrophobic membrane anchor protein [uncultured Thiodictyon sp.]|jgi:succinate dehydrogenase / fumarate reductase membrane anchor subunit|uniref:succinate dehydrogenase, hydrophobic membrane anchor protein n=1 Tax=uncultured Thiodictyon sp. TaxID=1846217 RepID=UPI0025EC9D3C|nr:succinate dehydrogenase, hydrophobic membrane anchor protein [uncultured Thiodictyon sp.]